jgi:hypothetical protein
MEGPGRSWPPPTRQEWHDIRDAVIKDRWSETMKKEDQGQCCTRNPERTDVWEKTLGETRMQERYKEPRLKGVATSWSKRTSSRIFRKTIGLQIMKLIPDLLSGFQK